MSHIINLIIIISLSVVTSFSQSKSEVEMQKYEFENTEMKIIFETNKVNFHPEDTLVITYTLKNTLTHNKFLFLKSNVKYIDTPNSKIIIDCGGEFVGGIEHFVELKLLKINSEFKMLKRIPIKDILEKKLTGYVYIAFGLGYIPNSDTLLNYEKINIGNSNNDDIYSFSSNSVEKFIKFNNYTSLWVNINEK